MLADQYTIVGVLGRPGGFGITYLAEDIRLESLVAIKEFLPRELATRAPDSTAVVTHSGDGDGGFRHGLEQFLREARTLAKIHHPSVVRVRQFFEANGTAYLVMDYLEGQTMSDLLKQEGGRLPPAQAVEIINRVLDGLRAAHALNIYHRDVKPSNIYITSYGLPVLLDFGAARQATGATSSKMTAVLTPGVAPLEQYGHRGQGPWTDVYAAAAVLYYAITGVDPVTATDRVGEEVDPMVAPADIDPDIGEPLSDAIMKGLAMAARNRPQTAVEFQRLLTAAIAATKSRADDAHPIVPEPKVQPVPKPGTIPYIPALADTLGPTDIASPEPLRPAASGSSPVIPIVPSLADTLGPADIPRIGLPSAPPPAPAKPHISVPSLADTVAEFRAPVRPSATPSASAPAVGQAARGPAEPPRQPDVDVAPSLGSGSTRPQSDPFGLTISDAFKTPIEKEVTLQRIVESDLPAVPDVDEADETPAARRSRGLPADLSADRESVGVIDVDAPVDDDAPVYMPAAEGAAADAPSMGSAGGGGSGLWSRVSDTLEKRIGLAAVALLVLVGTGRYLTAPRGAQPAVATADTTAKESTGETARTVDTAAISSASLDSIARVQDSTARADSIAKVAAEAKARDSVRLANAQKAAAARAARDSAARVRASASQDSARPNEATVSPQAAATALATAAEEHLRATVDDFVSVLRSRDERAITAALDDSERSAEGRAALLKFLRDRRPNVASVTPAEVAITGDIAHQLFTVKFTWREGRIRRSDHSDYAVFRATAQHAYNKWTSSKPELTRPPESK
jgi:serine/threonine protein kinase